MKTLNQLSVLAILLVSSLSANAGLNDQKQQQGQAQGQLQGQLQGQAQAQIGINKNANVNGNKNTNINGNHNANSNRNANANKNTNLNGQAQSTNNANNSSQNVNVEGDTFEAPELPVSTAYSHLAPPTAPCMGSSSAGGQGMNIGLSFGTTWTSHECMIFEAARSFQNAGATEDAMAIRCTSKYAAAAPTCIAMKKAAEEAKTAAIEAEKVATVKKADTVEVEVQRKAAVKSLPQPVVSENGYYSVVTNPLVK